VDSTSLAGHSILIVEVEPLIATALADAFARAGAQVVVAGSLQRATELIEADGLSAAVLDFGLRDGDANSLCSRLNERDIPYVLHSGHAHFGDACLGGIVIPKPADPSTLIRALRVILSH
jgi:DNA-binding response OmpR family regulator